MEGTFGVIEGSFEALGRNKMYPKVSNSILDILFRFKKSFLFWIFALSDILSVLFVILKLFLIVSSYWALKR